MKYIDQIAEHEADTLVEEREGPCISIYLPTHQVTTDADRDIITLKNLLSQAGTLLTQQGVKRDDAEELLFPFESLLTERNFWRYLSDGLALFASRSLHLSYRLPHSFDERVQVGSRFYLKPLLPLISEDGEFFVLALSANEVRLFEGTRNSIHQLTAEDLPRSMAAALRSDDIPAGATVQSPTGGEQRKKAYLQFFYAVDRAMTEYLHGRSVPLILAGVDYLLPIYAQANSYRNLIPDGIIGNVEQLLPQQIHTKGWEIAEPLFYTPRRRAEEEYLRLEGTGNTSSSLEEVVLGASSGRVKSIFVNLEEQRFGALNSSDYSITVHNLPEVGDYDLLDKAAVLTYRAGGEVFGCRPDQMPRAGEVAAVFRY